MKFIILTRTKNELGFHCEVILRHHPLSIDHQRYCQQSIIIDSDLLTVDGSKLLQRNITAGCKNKILKMADLNYFRGAYEEILKKS